MSTSAVTNAGEAERLLAATRQLIGTVRYCWAMTAGERGGVNARLMGRLPPLAGDDEWTVWFLTRDSSRKAAEIRRVGRLTVGYQHDVDGAYAVLTGPAALVEDRPGLRRRWQDSWKVHFRGPDDPDAVLVRMEVERIELCMRGVTPEPFGSRYLALARGSARQWEVVAA